jgi:NAD(P)-dependent dehydrogenase (short-subunit alcohol dehydrogenase family)
MSVATDAILKVVITMLLPESVIAQNVFYCLFKNTGGSNDDDDVLSDLVDWMEDIFGNINDQIVDTAVLAELTAYIRDIPGDDWDEVGSATLTDAFAGSSEMLPHGVAPITHAKTTNPDVQATKFWAGLVEGWQDQSVLSGGAVAAYLLAAGDWILDFVGSASGSDFEPGVWSPTNLLFYHFSGTIVQNAYLGYQRRRKPGVGI